MIKLKQKILISVIGVIVITMCFYIVAFKRQPMQEGLDVNSLLKKGFDDAFKPVKTFFTDEFTGPLNEIGGFVSSAEQFLENMPELLNDISHFFTTVGTGIEQEFTNLGVSIKTGFEDIFSLIGLFKNVFIYLNQFFNTYIASRINCGLTKISNLRYCFLFYLMDLFGYTIWGIFIQFPVWIISLCGLNLQPIIDMFLSYVDKFDVMFFGLTGYNLMHYSKHTIDLCYSCQGLQDMPEFPTQQFQDQISKINTDLNVTVPTLMAEASGTMVSAEEQLLAILV